VHPPPPAIYGLRDLEREEGERQGIHLARCSLRLQSDAAPWHIPLVLLLAELAATSGGLTSEDAQERLAKYERRAVI
jgi:hypothetical protein